MPKIVIIPIKIKIPEIISCEGIFAPEIKFKAVVIGEPKSKIAVALETGMYFKPEYQVRT
jgi:hypothetical protein